MKDLGVNPELSWEIEINILKSIGVIREVLKVLSIVFGMVFLFVFILWAIDGFPSIIDLADIRYGLIMVFISVLLTVVFIAILANKYPVYYELNSSGAKFITLGRQKDKNRLVAIILIIAGLFTRNIRSIGIGSISYSRQDMFTSWNKVRKIIYFKKRKEIHLVCKDMTRNILFCREENVERALDIVHFYCDKARVVKK